MPAIAEAESLTDHYKPARFSQFELLQQHGKEVVGGVCFLLCVHWILHHKGVRSAFGQKKPTDVRIAYLQGKEKFLTICAGQEKFLQSLRGKMGDVVEYERAEAKAYGVTLAAAGSLYTTPKFRRREFEVRAEEFENAKFMASLLGPHTYHVVNLDGQHNHTVCWYSSGNWFADNHLYVFDPNIGEFRTAATKAEAGAFLAKLLQEYGEKGNEVSQVNVYKATIDTGTAAKFI